MEIRKNDILVSREKASDADLTLYARVVSVKDGRVFLDRYQERGRLHLIQSVTDCTDYTHVAELKGISRDYRKAEREDLEAFYEGLRDLSHGRVREPWRAGRRSDKRTQMTEDIVRGRLLVLTEKEKFDKYDEGIRRMLNGERI